jgi:polysaccharide export outer membrane protein
MKNLELLGLAGALALSAIGANAQDGASKPRPQSELAAPKDAAANVPAADQAAKPAIEDPNYQIGPEDEVNVNVWREPDISRTVPVRPDGKISLPLLNDVQAAGLTPMQLGLEITTRLKKFVSEPQVTIIVTKVNSQRIYLVGEVTRAGAYPLLPSMTVLEAISSAGGCTPFAKQTKIYVLRKENGKEIKLSFNYKEVLAGQHTEQNVALKPGDTVVVP